MVGWDVLAAKNTSYDFCRLLSTRENSSTSSVCSTPTLMERRRLCMPWPPLRVLVAVSPPLCARRLRSTLPSGKYLQLILFYLLVLESCPTRRLTDSLLLFPTLCSTPFLSGSSTDRRMWRPESTSRSSLTTSRPLFVRISTVWRRCGRLSS